MPGVIAGLVVAVLRHAQIAGDHALDDTVLDDQVVRGKAGIDFHAQRFGLRRPASGRDWTG